MDLKWDTVKVFIEHVDEMLIWVNSPACPQLIFEMQELQVPDRTLDNLSPETKYDNLFSLH